MSDRATVLDAVQRGHLELLRAALSDAPELANARNDEGVSLVLLCLYQHRQDLLEVVQGHGPELDVFAASALGGTTRLRELLTDDAEAVRAWSGDGFTPLHLACFFGREAAARALVAAGAGVDVVSRNGGKLAPIHSAAASRKAAIVQLLIDAGAAVDVHQVQGWTPLHAAAQHGDLAMTTALLAAGADVGLVSDDGQCAIDLAEAAGHAEVARALRNRAQSGTGLA